MLHPTSPRSAALPRHRLVAVRLVLAALLLPTVLAPALGKGAERKKILITSSLDGTRQPSYLMLPDGFKPDDAPRPLLVSLHSWSGDLNQRHPELEAAALERGWIYLFPNFRGRNDDPDACGSEKAQQDILDAVAWARDNLPVDERRIYLAGASGGGHMTMLMVGRHPQVWAAASAWVGISDLRAWHRKHADSNYGRMLRACCGGAPGESEEVDREYRQRSPLTWLHRAAGVPLDIAAGIHDGHTGSVPIRHSLEAFNEIAKAAGAETVSEAEMQQLSTPRGRLAEPRESDQVTDPSFGRSLYLRRQAGPARVTIFEGGHEAIDRATVAWLARHVKAVAAENR